MQIVALKRSVVDEIIIIYQNAGVLLNMHGNEWLPRLNTCLKWFKTCRDFKVGDIFMVMVIK